MSTGNTAQVDSSLVLVLALVMAADSSCCRIEAHKTLLNVV
ncbi:hypothetical protein [Candidatus Electrothrix sp.]